MELLQDLSVDFSQLVKKHIKGLKKLSSKDQKAFGKLFGDFKDGLDDLSTNESVNEVQEPEIITQLRKGGYQTLKDPQTGKKVKIDNYSSSAIVAVYDALKKDKVKEKFVNLPLPKMVNVAFKAMK